MRGKIKIGGFGCKKIYKKKKNHMKNLKKRHRKCKTHYEYDHEIIFFEQYQRLDFSCFVTQ